MTEKPEQQRDEREIPPPKSDPGMLETDDHAMAGAPRGEGQPVDELDPGVDDEHLKSPSQGVRPER